MQKNCLSVLLFLILFVLPFSQARADSADPNVDLNSDGIVDSQDLVIFASQWLAEGTNTADFSNDGVVNSIDFAALASKWMFGFLPYQNQYSGGSGTSADPYQIANVSDWQVLASASADWNKCFILNADIDFRGVEVTPVGNSSLNFTGSFDGAGHIIRNVTIKKPDQEYVGLFGYIGADSKIQNMGLMYADIAGRNYVGSLIGRNDGGRVADCNVTGMVNGVYYTGGLIGLNAGNVVDCYATGSVKGGPDSNYIGGFIGGNSGEVNRCYALSFVNVGPNSRYIGGLAGINSVNVMDCYATGDVSTGSNSNYVGGLIGNNFGDANFCYSTGAVSGDSNVGGLVGLNEGAVDNSFWDIQTSGQTISAGGTGKTTAEMKTLATFTSEGWNLSDVNGDPADWKMVENITYPQFVWEPNETIIMVAAADAPEWFKSMANYICDGINDNLEINAALGNNRHVVLSSGTFNITAYVKVAYNNVILEGQGPSTIIRNVTSMPLHVIYQWGPKHDITIKNLQLDNNDYGNPIDPYNKCLFINGNFTSVFGIDNKKYLCIKAHISSPDNRPVTGPNYKTYWSPVSGWGSWETWAAGISYTGIDSCYNILIEGITGHDSRAEVICVDYSEHITIRDCNTYNGAWSGITVAHTRYSSIYNNQIRHCGELPGAGSPLSRGINVIGSSYVSIYDNWVRDCMTGGIGVNETYGYVECVGINIYDNHIIDTIGGPGIVVQSSNSGVSDSNTYDVNICGNYIDTYREVKLDTGGVAVDNGDGTVTLPATYNGFRGKFWGLYVKIAGTINYNGYFTLKNETDDDHLVIAKPYAAEQFNGTETVSQITDGMWFDHVVNFNVINNTIEPEMTYYYSYWCNVKPEAVNGLVEDNRYIAGATYFNQSPSTLFINNTEILP